MVDLTAYLFGDDLTAEQVALCGGDRWRTVTSSYSRKAWSNEHRAILASVLECRA